ncbi:hypothetical protein BN865_03610 [Campylobacter coli 76339]|nr:hypothetical protein BN865_03610 [Campylobacter coli 76339]
MWTTQRKGERIMTALDIFQIIFIFVVVLIGFAGMIWVISKDKSNR